MNTSLSLNSGSEAKWEAFTGSSGSSINLSEINYPATVGNVTVTSCSRCNGLPCNCLPSIGYYYSYPFYNSYSSQKDKAFDIAKKLLEKKVVNPQSVEKFIKLVDSIRECL